MRYQLAVAEGVISESIRPHLFDDLRLVASSSFDVEADSVEIGVLEVPAGRWFTAGEPSRSSIVYCEVPVGTQQEDRIDFMNRVTSLWCASVGCSASELVVTAADTPNV